MAAKDITFEFDGNPIQSPQALESGTPVTIRIVNSGEEDQPTLGMFLVPADSLGTWEDASEGAPATDYQTILTWGTNTVLEEDTQGGLKVTYESEEGEVTSYFTRLQGSLYENRIALLELEVGEYHEITLELETPTGEAARKIYVSLAVE